MSTTVTPPPRKVNRAGLEVASYKGAKTTLCAGCGHNAISERLIECFFEMGVQPWTVAKFSGIGCSSKSPAYFLSLSHGFNAVHGRAPAVGTGAMLANRREAADSFWNILNPAEPWLKERTSEPAGRLFRMTTDQLVDFWGRKFLFYPPRFSITTLTMEGG